MSLQTVVLDIAAGFGKFLVGGLGLRLYGSTSGHVGLKPAAVAGSTDYILPAADGSAGQAVTTNGSATLGWTTFVVGPGSAADGDVVLFNSTTGALVKKSPIANLDANRLYVNGQIRIGTDTPNGKVTVAQFSSHGAESYSENGIYSYNQVTLSASNADVNSNVFGGQPTAVLALGGFNAAGGVVGQIANAIVLGSGNLTGFLAAIEGQAFAENSGTMAEMSAFLGSNVVSSGCTATKSHGFKVRDCQVSGILTNQYGLSVDDLTVGANNYGVHLAVSSGANKWNIYADGTAKNYFAGQVEIGSASQFVVTTSGVVTAANLSGTNTGDQDLSGLVPKTTTVNGHALTGNVTVTNADVGLGNVTNVAQLPLSYLDTDGTLAANSDTRVASQKAVKAYADGLIAANDAMQFKGVLDCSANPNYPAANAGETYRISVAGKIGGGSGINVEVGDLALCITDGSSAGNQATVGSNWNLVQSNLDGAMIGPSSSTDGNFALYSGATGKLLQNSAYSPASFEVPLTFSTGLTRTTNTITVNTTQNIAKLSNLATNGVVKTSGGDGTLSISKVAITEPAAGSTLTILNGFTLTVSANANVSGTNSGDQDLSSLVVGPGSSTDGNIVLFNGTTGKLVKNSAFSPASFEVPLTFSTGLTRTTNTITVNTMQSISKLSNLATNGIVKTSGGDGTLGIAVAGDFPTLNQTTTGSAATLTTPRTINGVAFDGSANITIPSAASGQSILQGAW